MFKKLIRAIKPNPLDAVLRKAVKNKHKKILICWNRGVGDLPLGLFAICHRIKEFIPDSKITFLSRADLKEGFALLNRGNFICAPKWKRRQEHDVLKTLKELNISQDDFDIIIDKPDISYSIKWQIGKLMPKLYWKDEYDHLCEKFDLPEDVEYMAVQPQIESGYAFWRNWPLDNFYRLFNITKKIPNFKIILIGVDKSIPFKGEHIIDLRGRTTLLEALSIIKNRCKTAFLPDSGLLTLLYYLNVQFDINVVSLWANAKLGIMGQKVESPNKLLKHYPCIGKKKDLSVLHIQEVLSALFGDYDFYIQKLLQQEGQLHCFDEVKWFTKEEKKSFLCDLLLLEKDIGKKQKIVFPNVNHIDPLKNCPKSSSQDIVEGEKLLFSGKVAVMILAGGEGTRLGFAGPKGSFPISNVKNKSCFQLFSEKIFFAEKKYKKPIPLIIFTSSCNHEETVKFFKERKFFSLDEKNILFLCQNDFPAVDDNGNWMVKDKKLLLKASGNGDIYSFSNKIIEFLDGKNIEIINVMAIENPLFDPVDKAILGFHKNQNNEVTIKCVISEKEDNKGVLALVKEKVKIIEYLDISNVKEFSYINIGFYCFNLSFFNKNIVDLPLHRAYKKGVWKYERFIFDGFDKADKVGALCCERWDNFAPLKSKEDIAIVKKALFDFDCRKYFESRCVYNFELSPEFYYFPEHLKLYKKSTDKILGSRSVYLKGKYSM